MAISSVKTGTGTNTCTVFGRHFPVFLDLDRHISGMKMPECLVAGPGLAEHRYGYPFFDSYEPFELVNALLRAGINDFNVTVMDIDSDVLNEFDNGKNRIHVSRDFWEHLKVEIIVDKYAGRSYYDHFFPQYSRYDSRTSKTVFLPQEIIKRIEATRFDFVREMLPMEEYDIVVCMTVLSHYINKGFGEKLDRKGKANLEAAVRPGGILIGSGFDYNPNQWDMLAYADGNHASVHDRGCEVLRKKQ